MQIFRLTVCSAPVQERLLDVEQQTSRGTKRENIENLLANSRFPARLRWRALAARGCVRGKFGEKSVVFFRGNYGLERVEIVILGSDLQLTIWGDKRDNNDRHRVCLIS